MKMNLDRISIERALGLTAWDLGNEVLYELCRQQPLHERDDVVIAKLWLIGRTYAAAIERRKADDSPYGDRFYTEHVAPAIRHSKLTTGCDLLLRSRPTYDWLWKLTTS